MLSFLTSRFSVVVVLDFAPLCYQKKSWNIFFQLCNLPLSFLLVFSRPCWRLSSLSLILNTLKRNKRKKYLESIKLPVIFFFLTCTTAMGFYPGAHLFLSKLPPAPRNPKRSDAMEAGLGLVTGGLGADHSTILHQLGSAEQVTHPLWAEEWWYLLWRFVYRLKRREFSSQYLAHSMCSINTRVKRNLSPADSTGPLAWVNIILVFVTQKPLQLSHWDGWVEAIISFWSINRW